MISLIALAFACGLSPYIPVLVLGFAARSGVGPEVRPGFGFVESWGFLGVALVLVGLDVVLDKLPATSARMSKIGWAVRPICGALAAGSAAGLPLALGIAGGAALALLSYGLRNWLIGRLAGRLYGLERVAVGAYSELGSAVISAFAVFIPAVGVAVAVIAAGLSLYAGRLLRTSQPK